MSKKLKKGWSLIDGDEMNRNHPDSFEMPPEQDRLAVEAGNFVKIGLASKDGGERFWVQVLHTVKTPNSFAAIGQLNIGLFDSRPGIGYGDQIRFGKGHILEIHEIKVVDEISRCAAEVFDPSAQ